MFGTEDQRQKETHKAGRAPSKLSKILVVRNAIARILYIVMHQKQKKPEEATQRHEVPVCGFEIKENLGHLESTFKARTAH